MFGGDQRLPPPAPQHAQPVQKARPARVSVGSSKKVALADGGRALVRNTQFFVARNQGNQAHFGLFCKTGKQAGQVATTAVGGRWVR